MLLHLSSDIFATLADQDPIELHFFTPEEVEAMEKAIERFHSGEGKREGGQFLETHLKSIEVSLTRLVKHVGAVTSFIRKEPTKGRVSKSAIQQEAIESIASTWKGMPEKIVREFASKLIGEEKANNFTVDELPYVIAVWQVKHEVMAVL